MAGYAMADTAVPALKVDSPHDPKSDLKINAQLREPRFWVATEYVHTWQNATTATPDLVDQVTVAPNSSTVTPMYNQKRVAFGDGNAVRLTLGGWIDRDEKFGAELSGFYTPRQTETDSITGTPNGPILTAPFGASPLNGVTAGKSQIGGPIGSTGVQGYASFTSTTESYGGEGNLLAHLLTYHHGPDFSVDASGLGGFRYFGVADQFQESIGRESLPPALGNNFSGTDSYQTQSNFYGADFGGRVRVGYEGLFAELTPKLGLGVTDESVDVSGTSSASSGGTPLPALNPGGFLAIGNKLGDRSTDKFAVLPQLTLKVGYDLTKQVEVFVGYDVLYLSQVARASGQVSNQVGASTSPFAAFGGIPGGADNSPPPAISSTSFLQQGVSAGLSAKF